MKSKFEELNCEINSNKKALIANSTPIKACPYPTMTVYLCSLKEYYAILVAHHKLVLCIT